MTQIMNKARWKHLHGKIHKMWGKLTHNPYEEFLGEQAIMEAKIEEFYAHRSGESRHSVWAARNGLDYVGRQRNLVA